MDALPGLTTSPCYFNFSVEVVPIVRGHLAVALEFLPESSDAALEVCAAWSELDEAAQLPTIHEVTKSETAAEALECARALLHDATLTSPDARRTLAYGRAARHLDAATAGLSSMAGGA